MKKVFISLMTLLTITGLGILWWFIWVRTDPIAKNSITIASSSSTKSSSKPKLTIKRPKHKKIESEAEKKRKKISTEERQPTNHIPEADSYAYRVEGVKKACQIPVDPNKPKIVFLTFDDGPSENDTPKVLDILKSNGVHATFFLVGRYMDDNGKKIIQREYNEGNGIAVHSYTHNYSLLYPNGNANVQTITNEAKQDLDILHSFMGVSFTTHVWRYPGGHMSWHNLTPADKALEGLGLDWIDWNAAVGDALGQRSPKTVEGMMQYHAMSLNVYEKSNVEVILMHDASDKQVTAQTLPELIKYYKDRNYKFGILS